MIKLFKRHENEKYIIVKNLFINITFKNKSPKSYIDAIVWRISVRKLRDNFRNKFY